MQTPAAPFLRGIISPNAEGPDRGNEVMAGADDVLETLISKGWYFRDPDHVRDLVRTKADPEPKIGSKSLLEMVESELLNTDLRSLGGRSLPDAANLKRLSHLQGPKLLQVVSTRDIYQSSIDASMRSSHHGARLLRFILTDGNSEITAIEYTSIPFISEDIIPGYKVRLENKIPIHNGILCLNPKVVTILGGIVDSLYEEWQLEQKYSIVSRPVSRHPNNSDSAGPPPFEKLQLGKKSHVPCNNKLCGSFSEQPVLETSTKWNSNDRPEERNQGHHREQHRESTSTVMHDASITTLTTKEVGNSSSSSSSRPREAIDVMPIQNQAAAQKLLQKMVQPSQGKWSARGQRHRVKAEDAPVFTLEEWENRKAGASKPAVVGEMVDVSHDEEIAWQLQRQLDFEDFHEGNGSKLEAEKIKMSMFNFQHGEERHSGRREARGRGRGRGRKRFG